jgi:hypothetical protein
MMSSVMKTFAAVVLLAAILHAAGFASSSSPSLPRLSILNGQ